jgi:hypothetical protein
MGIIKVNDGIMELFTNVFFTLVSHLPRLASGWLYSPERTKENVEVSISATEGSVELWCDREQAAFKVRLEFKNNNPFPIEIDRIEASGRLHTASVKAFDLFGGKIEQNKKTVFWLTGKLDEVSLERINAAPDEERLRLEVRAFIINKYHYIRDFSSTHDRLICRFCNKKPQKRNL